MLNLDLGLFVSVIKSGLKYALDVKVRKEFWYGLGICSFQCENRQSC